ncbi:hypothetical protein LguiB_010529 [Lonicera macranthoides]
MEKTENIRNVGLLGHINHAKVEYFVEEMEGGLEELRHFPQNFAFSLEKTIIPRLIEGGCGVWRVGKKTVIKSLLLSQAPTPAISFDYGSNKINLILDCAESAMIDGVLVVVDSNDGFSCPIGALLQQAVAEKVHPVLCITKLDRYFLDLSLDGESAYQRLRNIVEEMNTVLATYEDHPVGGDDVRVYPEKATVAFSSGLQGWGFTLSDFAKLYSAKFGVGKAKMMERLWGENFYDFATRKWTERNTGSATCKRGFVGFCYEPIEQVIKACLAAVDEEKLRLWDMLARLGIRVAPEDKCLKGRELIINVLQHWLPLREALLRMVVDELPSPFESQQHRVHHLYSGPLGDPYAEAIRNCDLSGSVVMVYLSNSLRGTTHHHKKRCALARIFSGRLTAGMKVRLVSPRGREEEEEGGGAFALHLDHIKRIATWKRDQLHYVTEVTCGNIAAIYVGSDQLVSKRTLVADNNNNNKKKKGGGGGLLLLDQQPHPIRSTQLDVRDDIVAADASRETVLKRSSRVLIYHKDRALSVTARPLDENMIEAIEKGRSKQWKKMVGDELGWDPKVSHSRICSSGPNLLLDHSKGGLNLEYKKTLEDAFQQATHHGALAGKTLRGVCFEVHEEKSGGGYEELAHVSKLDQLFHVAQLRAHPCLLEKFYRLEIQQAPRESLLCVSNAIYQMRGRVFEEEEEEDSFFYTVRGYIPVDNSDNIFNLIAEATRGTGRADLKFDHWEQVSPDPI